MRFPKINRILGKAQETNMKKQSMRAGFFGLMALAGLAGLNAQTSLTLDDAIQQSAAEIEERLAEGVKIVALNFASPSERLSDYIMNELAGALANSGNITVVDRQNLALIQQEMDFPLSGEVRDESAQEIGRKLGAQSIVSGSIEDAGKYYRLRFRVIEAAGTALQLQPSKNVRKDRRIAALMRDAVPVAGQPAAGEPLASAGYPRGLNFSTQRKVNAGFLNMFFWGIGSHIMGDWVGGMLIGGLQVTATMLSTIGYMNILAVMEEEEKYNGNTSVSIADDDRLVTATVMLVSSGVLALAQVVVSFVRPFAYDKALAKKNGTYTGLGGNPLEHINIVLLPGKNGPAALNFTYSFSY
jgi:TolB-like protein